MEKDVRPNNLPFRVGVLYHGAQRLSKVAAETTESRRAPFARQPKTRFGGGGKSTGARECSYGIAFTKLTDAKVPTERERSTPKPQGSFPAAQTSRKPIFALLSADANHLRLQMCALGASVPTDSRLDRRTDGRRPLRRRRRRGLIRCLQNHPRPEKRTAPRRLDDSC